MTGNDQNSGKQAQALGQMRPDDAVTAFTGRFVRLSREILQGNLTGVYLHGSAAMGCWQPEKSDLDYIVVVKEEMEDSVRRSFMDRLLALDAEGPAKGIEMSIVAKDVCNPFVYPTPFLLHYSRGHTAWYLRDPEDYIRHMKGTDQDLAAHFTVIRQRGVCVYGLPVDQAFGEVPEEAYLDAIWYDVGGAEEEIAENPMYLILNLARAVAFRETKTVLSKREGGEWGLKNLPETWHPLLRAALREYEGETDVAYDPALAGEYAACMLQRFRQAAGLDKGDALQ